MMFGSRHRTLRRPVTVSGIGIHRGESVTLTFPARRRGPGDPLPARGSRGAHRRSRRTSTTSPAPSSARRSRPHRARASQTVEHLMAALAAAGISRVVAEIDGPEAPILDGSFEGYLAPLREAGVVELDDPLPVLSPPRPLSLDGEDGDQSYVALPHPSPPYLGHDPVRSPPRSAASTARSPSERAGSRRRSPAPAPSGSRRRRRCCERGASRAGPRSRNTVVPRGGGDPQRRAPLPGRISSGTKVGDLVGDLALLGARIDAHIIAERPSHRGNIALARALAREGRRNAARAPVLDISQILEYLPHPLPHASRRPDHPTSSPGSGSRA